MVLTVYYYFNTSHVNVNLTMADINNNYKDNFNTSHVNVNLKSVPHKSVL